MSVVALFSPLKGVGKTTLVMALADFLPSTYQRSVLVVDLDTTGDLSVRLIGDQRWWALERDRRTVLDGLMESPSGPTGPLHVEAIHRVEGARSVGLLAGTARLAELERTPQGDPAQARRFKTPLRDRLKFNSISNNLILINMPPQLGDLAQWALAACDGYLLVVNATRASSAAASSASRQLEAWSSREPRGPRRYGAVLNRLDPGSSTQATILSELEQSQELAPLWTTRIPSSPSPMDAVNTRGDLPLRARWRSLYGPLDALALEFARRVP